MKHVEEKLTKILESGEDYLESILKLSKTQTEIHAIDVVRDLGYSKPSVSIALKKLRDGGFVTIDDNQHLHLTNDGLLIAEKIYERHLLLTKMLTNLGVNEEIAENDACKIEHDLSPETWEVIKKHYNNTK